MSVEILGLLDWSGGRDEQGHRTYKARWLGEASSVDDGPYQAMSADGLPPVGSPWNINNEFDLWAFASPILEASRYEEEEGDPGIHWAIEQTFTSKPRSGKGQEDQAQNPLYEPYGIRGSFQQMMREIAFDKNGQWIHTASYEPVKGPAVERNIAQPTVSISLNYPDLPLADIAFAMNKVNSSPMWGLPARHIALVSAPWERKYLTKNIIYYAITFEFLVDLEGFDKEIIQEGTRALREAGLPKEDPKSYIPAVDGQGNPTTWLLNADGTKKTSGSPVKFKPEIDREANFYIFGMPTRL